MVIVVLVVVVVVVAAAAASAGAALKIYLPTGLVLRSSRLTVKLVGQLVAWLGVNVVQLTDTHFSGNELRKKLAAATRAQWQLNHMYMASR